jgi:hypothetical protein
MNTDLSLQVKRRGAEGAEKRGETNKFNRSLRPFAFSASLRWNVFSSEVELNYSRHAA